MHFSKTLLQDTGFDGSCVAPPPLDLTPLLPSDTASAAMAEFNDGSTISDEVVRDALLELVATNRCWGDAAAKQMIIEKVEPVPALHYKLESFSEERITKVYHGLWMRLGSFNYDLSNKLSNTVRLFLAFLL